MPCPRCGEELSSAGRCPHCSASITSAATVGLLTPVPAGRSTATVDSGTAFDNDAPTLMPGSPICDDDAATLLSGFPGPHQELSNNGALDASSGPVDTGPLTTGQTFGPRYHIIRPLGIGGMGAVYQAWDAELGVAVAIKVIRPEVMSDSGTAADVERRFKQELLLARQVTHRNVVRIHDLGEIDRIKYITMPYMDGADLATVLKRDGKPPIANVIRIARGVVAGLVAAHKAGVVHRDLKPANIMIDAEGEAVIMDFGIARSTGGAATTGTGTSLSQLTQGSRAPSRADLTVVGTVVGTVEYMAPEQAKGESVDQRADVYALGLILYDMLLGRRRVGHSDSPITELKGRMEQSPPTARSVMPEIPEALDRLVMRCLQPDPAARYQTTEDLAVDLNRLDENGEPIPIRRVVGLPLVSAVVVVLLMLSVGTWWYSRQLLPAAPHDPVSVLIADFLNGTNDPTFDRTLEPMLKRALEGASFITAYDRSGISTLGVRPPEKLDEVAARELAVKQGVGVVLSGALARQGNGYGISVKATQTVTGNVIASAQGKASNKDQVLATATKLVTAVRTALGDDTSDSAQMFAMASISATSLEVLSQYAAGREASSAGKFDEARRSYAKAVELDPKFGIGYQSLATLSLNLGNVQDADKYFKEALGHLDGMTERERYTTRGMYYRMTGDYPQCVKEYNDLIARYAADVLARNNLALCLTFLRNMPGALNEMQQAVQILPKRALFRLNLAVYASYASDFQTGEKEARSAQELGSPLSLVPLAFAQLGQDQLAETANTYEELGKVASLGPVAASYTASGLGDIGVYEGRFSEAVRILGDGAAADLSSNSADRAAAKFASLAYAQLSRGQKGAAATAVEKALVNSKAVKIRFLAARILVEADQIVKARPLMAGLASEIQAEPQAYAKIVEGDAFVKSGDVRQAIKVLSEANILLDTWIGHFDLGRAYLNAGLFAQADSEFDRCIKRRGEALSLFLDEEPTYGYLPPVYYYQGRVRQELNNAGFAESYQKYLGLRGKSTEDPLLPDVRRRAGVK